MNERCPVCSTAAELREKAQADSRHLLATGGILILLFVFALPGVGAWSISLAFLVLSCLAGAMILKAPLSWPVRMVFFAILAFILLLQGMTRVVNDDACETNGRQVRPAPGFMTSLRGLNPFEYEGCFTYESD
jgi:hypothetical protein